MIKNYLKIAWRNLIKNKSSSVINIGGLAVGMAVAMLIGLWIWDELSYDKYFKNYNSIVQVMQSQGSNGVIYTGPSIPMPLGAKMHQNYKRDFKYLVLSSWVSDHVLANANKKLITNGGFMQSEAPHLFSLKMLEGSQNSLQDMSSVLLSKKLSVALFGSSNPINKTVILDSKFNLKVAGVYEDLPQNTSLNKLAFIAPWELYITTQPYLKRAETEWTNNSWQIFAQLNDNTTLNKASAHIRDIKLNELKHENDKAGLRANPQLFLYPMSRWHLHSEFKNGVPSGGAIQFVWMFGIVGIFVLLLACINFMNLSTARSEKRAKEVGIRKAVGSLRSHLIGQFFGESLLVTLFAFTLSLLLVKLTLPWFNEVAGKTMELPLQSFAFWAAGLLFALFTGVIAGSYPAFYLSSFQPVKVLKGTFRMGRFSVLPRKILVVLQFTVSITLIIGTLVVFRQVQFTKNRPVNYNRTGLIQVTVKNDVIHKQFNAIRNDLLQAGAIVDMAESGSPLTNVWYNSGGYKWRDKDPNLQDDFGIIPVSHDFGNTVAWKVADGRDFATAGTGDSLSVILNESAVKFMNFKHPLGEAVYNGNIKYSVIGVVKDMVMASPYEPVKPTLFFFLNYSAPIIDIKLNPKVSPHQALAKVAAIFKQYDTANPFDYQFTDEEYANKFAEEQRIGTLAGFFTILAIFISCLGLFGMASFMAEQRTKEIGVRKVLGATIFGLWRMLSTDFVFLVLIAMLFAMPTAWYFMRGWLQHYSYRAELSWWIFAATGIGAITITLLTVSYQSVKAALMNPVASLKSE